MKDPDELMRISRENLETMLNESGKRVFDRILQLFDHMDADDGDIQAYLRERMKEILK